jgi:hypothetical protein
VFVVSDIINEYFGKKGVKWISYLTAINYLCFCRGFYGHRTSSC